MKARFLVLTMLLAMAGAARADENGDLDLIPGSAPQNAPPPAAPSPLANKFFIEDAAGLGVNGGRMIVPYPKPLPATAQNRTSLDDILGWTISPSLSLSFSDRLNATEPNNVPDTADQIVHNDFREGFLTWQPARQLYLEAGRINLRNGVALGFNPTDFFKTGSEVEQSTLDPSALSRDRLGTVMARGQMIWAGGSLTIALAPELDAPSRITSKPPPSFDPGFGRTNNDDRALVTLGLDIADLAPQAMIYHEADETRFGLDVSHPLGQSVILYGEWAGGDQQSLVARAIAYGKQSGSIPALAPLPPGATGSGGFRNDLALGFSWTGGDKITINAEYHYHQSGFSPQQWHSWFNSGASSNELWYIRGYANEQEEPITRQQAFLRFDWNDALITNLELTALAFVNLNDGSTLSQFSAAYYLSDAWTIGGYVTVNAGSPRSERGSLPQKLGGILQIDRYF